MRLQFGKKLDVGIMRMPNGGLKLNSKYVEVNALKVQGKSLSDYIAMVAKKRKFAFILWEESRRSKYNWYAYQVWKEFGLNASVVVAWSQPWNISDPVPTPNRARWSCVKVTEMEEEGVGDLLLDENAVAATPR